MEEKRETYELPVMCDNCGTRTRVNISTKLTLERATMFGLRCPRCKCKTLIRDPLTTSFDVLD